MAKINTIIHYVAACQEPNCTWSQTHENHRTHNAAVRAHHNLHKRIHAPMSLRQLVELNNARRGARIAARTGA